MQSTWREPVHWDDKKEVSRTKDGLLFLSLGAIVASVPLLGIGFVGEIIAVIGAILVILGRKAFGEKHSKYVLVSTVIYLVGFLTTAIFALAFTDSLVSTTASTTSNDALRASLSNSFNQFLIGTFIGSIISGGGQVLFTYRIQNKRGRVFLWTGYASTLGVGIIILLAIMPQISTALVQAFSNGSYDASPLLALQSQTDAFRLLNIVPGVIFALGYYSALVRIRMGEALRSNSPLSRAARV